MAGPLHHPSDGPPPPLTRVRSGLLALVLAGLALASPATLAAAKPTGTFKGVSKVAMLEAAKHAPMKLIDAFQVLCDSETYVETWLGQLTARDADSISWTAGRCTLTNKMNPIDAGGGYCVDANIQLKHPKNRNDVPVVEIYLDDPKHGQPGPAYAFRDIFDTNDGPDYERDRTAFQAQWRERFKDAPPAPCVDG